MTQRQDWTPEKREEERRRSRANHQKKRDAIAVLPPPATRRKIREDAGLSRTELARMVGLGKDGRASIRVWEEDPMGPRRHDLLAQYGRALAELAAAPNPKVDRALDMLENVWETVLAVKNGHRFSVDQEERLRRQYRIMQMAANKNRIRREQADGQGPTASGSGENHPGPEGEPGTEPEVG